MRVVKDDDASAAWSSACLRQARTWRAAGWCPRAAATRRESRCPASAPGTARRQEAKSSQSPVVAMGWLSKVSRIVWIGEAMLLSARRSSPASCSSSSTPNRSRMATIVTRSTSSADAVAASAARASARNSASASAPAGE